MGDLIQIKGSLELGPEAKSVLVNQLCCTKGDLTLVNGRSEMGGDLMGSYSCLTCMTEENRIWGEKRKELLRRTGNISRHRTEFQEL